MRLGGGQKDLRVADEIPRRLERRRPGDPEAHLLLATRTHLGGVDRRIRGAVYPLADAREAFMAKSTQHIPGKVVLTP